MFEPILVPLVLADTLNLVDGKTRFQKLMFLIQKEAERNGIKGLDFDYEIYLHGPFSRELSVVIDDLVDKGYLEEKTTETASGYTKYIYKLKAKSKEMMKHAMSKKLLSSRMLKSIKKVLDEYGDMPLPQLVEEAYRQF